MVLIIVLIIVNISIFTNNSFYFANNEKSLKDHNYSAEQISYFFQLAFAHGSIKKWNNSITIKVQGNPTDEDKKTLENSVAELNQNIKYFNITIDNNSIAPNTEIYFVNNTDFPKYLSQIPASTDSGFYLWWAGNGYIYKSVILINSNIPDQTVRSNYIKRSLLNNLGLGDMTVNIQANDSLFNNDLKTRNTSNPSGYSDFDKTMLRILYNPDIGPNMVQNDVKKSLGL